MAETLVETRICDACGVDVRPGSMFCYNCGGSVAADSDKSLKSKKNNKVSDVWFRDEFAAASDLKTTRLDKKVGDKSVEETEVADETEGIEAAIPKPSIQEEAKLKSAASMRRKAKTFQKKKVEVVWEESENSPSARFILAALILVIFVVLIFLAAMYLK